MESGQAPDVVWRNRALTLFDRIPIPVAVCDVYGAVVLANPAMAAEWGGTPGSLRGRNVLDLFRPQEPTQIERIAHALRLRHRSRYPVSVCWDAADGVPRHGELTAAERPGRTRLLAARRPRGGPQRKERHDLRPVVG
ncbi:PAS domain-containing protein, partial [Streptomyces sp. NPDC001215]